LAFGAIAALLAIVGIYGVIAYSVAHRTREIGVRVALGARPQDVGRMVLHEGVLLAVSGIAIGLAGSFALTRILRSLLFETTPTDAATLASVAGASFCVVVLATLLPARRAARVDPIVALRHE
jgi:putative ABC transport system permease protein